MNEIFECDACHRNFKSATSLKSHYRFCKVGTHITERNKISKYKTNLDLYRCECGKEFQKSQSLNAHFCYCLKHKQDCGLPIKIADSKVKSGSKCNFSIIKIGKEKHQQIRHKAVQTLKQRIKDGIIIPTWKGKHLSTEHKKKCSLSTCQYIIKTHGGPRYNKSSIPVLEKIAKEHGWNIQHAENGGEFYTGIGYFVDAYDKEKNIVIEYDEPTHYIDAENNVLRKKDLDRQQRIIEHLHCEYYRYNEITNKLWRI